MIFGDVGNAQDAQSETGTVRGAVVTTPPDGQSYNIPAGTLKLKRGTQVAETSANEAGEYEFSIAVSLLLAGTDFIQVGLHTLITTRDFTKNHEITNQTFHFSPQLHQNSLERPLLYMVVEEMTRATEMIFSSRMSGSALAAALLTNPAERESVRGGHRATNGNGEGSYSRRVHRAVTEVAMAVRRAIGDMSTRPLASTRAA